MTNQIQLYSYYRSSCSWRVRLALYLKSVQFEIIPINLLESQQNSEEYLQINPSGSVPALKINALLLTQSMAILEYLEEAFPHKLQLLPSEPAHRAQVRRLCLILVADCQPLQNFSVQNKIIELYSRTRPQVQQEWAAFFIAKGLDAFSKACELQAGRYSFGSTVTLADLCLIPQLYNARRFGINVEEQFPRLAAIEEAFKQDHPEAYHAAHPDSQPDAK